LPWSAPAWNSANACLDSRFAPTIFMARASIVSACCLCSSAVFCCASASVLCSSALMRCCSVSFLCSSAFQPSHPASTAKMLTATSAIFLIRAIAARLRCASSATCRALSRSAWFAAIASSCLRCSLNRAAASSSLARMKSSCRAVGSGAPFGRRATQALASAISSPDSNRFAGRPPVSHSIAR